MEYTLIPNSVAESDFIKMKQYQPDDQHPDLIHTSEHDWHTYPDLRYSWETKAPRQDLKNVKVHCDTHNCYK